MATSEFDKAKRLKRGDVAGGPLVPISPSKADVRNAYLLGDFIAGFTGGFDVVASAKGDPHDAARPRTYKLTVNFHDVVGEEVVAEVVRDRNRDAGTLLVNPS